MSTAAEAWHHVLAHLAAVRQAPLVAMRPCEILGAIRRLRTTSQDLRLRDAAARIAARSDDTSRAWLRKNRATLEHIASEAAAAFAVLPASLVDAAKLLPRGQAIALAARIERDTGTPYVVLQQVAT